MLVEGEDGAPQLVGLASASLYFTSELPELVASSDTGHVLTKGDGLSLAILDDAVEAVVLGFGAFQLGECVTLPCEEVATTGIEAGKLLCWPGGRAVEQRGCLLYTSPSPRDS